MQKSGERETLCTDRAGVSGLSNSIQNLFLLPNDINEGTTLSLFQN